MTPETVAAIVAMVEQGLPPDRAARACGVAGSTLRSRRQRDPDFATAIKRAEAVAEGSFFGRILRHADRNWTAAAWILERRWPDRWRKRERDRHQAEQTDVAAAYQAAARAVEDAGGA